MKIFRPLWEDGAALAPQQFQQQARWNAHIADTVARMGTSHPWGVVNAEFDTAALTVHCWMIGIVAVSLCAIASDCIRGCVLYLLLKPS